MNTRSRIIRPVLYPLRNNQLQQNKNCSSLTKTSILIKTAVWSADLFYWRIRMKDGREKCCKRMLKFSVLVNKVNVFFSQNCNKFRNIKYIHQQCIFLKEKKISKTFLWKYTGEATSEDRTHDPWFTRPVL